jgi:hypothetical protein
MNAPDSAVSPNPPALTNGSGAAAILSAGIGSFALAILTFAGDKSANVKSMLIFYKPTGPPVRRNYSRHSYLAFYMGKLGMALAEQNGRCGAYQRRCSYPAGLKSVIDISTRR